jgi:hypothetical protein
MSAPVEALYVKSTHEISVIVTGTGEYGNKNALTITKALPEIYLRYPGSQSGDSTETCVTQGILGK